MMKMWSTEITIVVVVMLLALSEIMSDEPTPSRVADLATLAARVSELERRVQALETPTVSESAAVAEPLPVLEIHSETWCGPCQTLKADLAAIAEPGVEVKWVRFSDRVPAMRWTVADGKPMTVTGYTRGTVASLLDRVRAAHVARQQKSE
jgi:hypothetical protein